ncbi:MAG TPA: ABC transporter permease [Methanomassiliicoccales archaeon]|nr:ABC transporter permease [Methanomassiliicoccales archaeon]
MLRQVIALTVRELKHWYRVKVQIFLTLIQPLFWLLLFGQAFNIPFAPGEFPAPNYFTYMSVGMLAVVVLFTCMFSGMSIVWDRRFGFMNKLRASPIERGVIPMSRVIATMIRAMVSAVIVLVLAVAFNYVPGLNGLTLVNFDILKLLGILLVLFLLSLGFAAAFTLMALKIKSQEVLIGVANLVNLPLMFASSALFPTATMPDWLQTIAKYNPISWAADAIRQLAYEAPQSMYEVGNEIVALALFALAFVVLGALMARTVLKE